MSELFDWIHKGVCSQTDPEAFFPEVGASTKGAKAVCVGCEVQAQCLEYALTDITMTGVWGGKTHSERKELKKAA